MTWIMSPHRSILSYDVAGEVQEAVGQSADAADEQHEGQKDGLRIWAHKVTDALWMGCFAQSQLPCTPRIVLEHDRV